MALLRGESVKIMLHFISTCYQYGINMYVWIISIEVILDITLHLVLHSITTIVTYSSASLSGRSIIQLPTGRQSIEGSPRGGRSCYRGYYQGALAEGEEWHWQRR